jgi:toxin YhaV
MEVNDWKLYAHRLFSDQIAKLINEVASLKECDPSGYASHPKAKFLAAINKLIRQVIPDDPSSPDFRQGNTLGKGNKHWFRAKFHARYRLFFRFSSKHKVIIYVWINGEKTLRQRGAKTDPYIIFENMLKQGDPPQNFEQILKNSAPLDEIFKKEKKKREKKQRKE